VNFKIIAVMLFLFLAVSCVSATTITVGDNSNTNADFTSIQDAIDNANESTTIEVQDGVYYEEIHIDKSIFLEPAKGDQPNVIIYSKNSSNHIIHITAPGTIVTGFNLAGYQDEKPISGIYLDNVDNCSISFNTISNTQDSIILQESHECNIIRNNLSSNILHGIVMTDSNNNKIKKNNVFDNRFGIYAQRCDSNIIEKNNVSSNDGYGIALFESNSSTIEDNYVTKNEYGICFTSSLYNKIKENTIADNSLIGLVSWKTEEDVIESNTINSNDEGIFFNEAYGFIVRNNELIGNKEAINIESSSGNDISSNTIKNSFPFQYFAWGAICLLLLSILYHMNKKGYLLKGLIGLLMICIFLFSMMAIYLVLFSPSLPYYNVEVENIHFDTGPSQNNDSENVLIDMDLNYVYKDSVSLIVPDNERSNYLPVKVQISSLILNPAGTVGDHKPLTEDTLVLDFLQPHLYSNELELKDDRIHHVRTEVYSKRYYDYPWPKHGEGMWEVIGSGAIEIDLK
jgi:parallel beta-helix repeat protein